MSTTEDTHTAESRSVALRNGRMTGAILTCGSSLEVIGGAIAVIFSIIGLAGFQRRDMAAIATIAIGAALLAHGVSAAARRTEMLRYLTADRQGRSDLTVGLGSEVLGGACGIVFAVLSLANIHPVTLLAVAAVMFGGTMLIGAQAEPEIAICTPERDRRLEQLTYRAIDRSAGAMVVVGFGAAALGILALIRIGPPLTLVMVAMLGVGSILFVIGSALTARFLRRFAASV